MDEKKIYNEMNELKKLFKTLENQNKSLIREIDYIKQLCLEPEKINFCPICKNFSSFGDFWSRKNVLCPNCKSLERHRMVYLLLKNQYEDLLNSKIKLLHFAPELLFYKFFSEKKNIDYYPVDFSPEIYEKKGISIRNKVDMEHIPYENEKFDFIYNSHVLEHIPNDIKAMSELYRVLKPDGVCITLVPLFNIDTTFEKEEYNTPELRLKYYGQRDHVRKYGLDFKNRLTSVGFKVKEIHAEDLIKTKEQKRLFRLNGEIFVCTK